MNGSARPAEELAIPGVLPVQVVELGDPSSRAGPVGPLLRKDESVRALSDGDDDPATYKDSTGIGAIVAEMVLVIVE